MIDLFQEILGTLSRNVMRTIATGFAVVSGLFLLIVLQGAGNGVIHSFEYNMGGFAFDAIHVFGGMTTMPFEGIKEGRFIQLDDRDVAMVKKNFARNVKAVIPTLSQSGVVANVGSEHISSVELTGVYPLYAQGMAVKVLEGRFVNDIDLREKRKVLVMDKDSEKKLFKDGRSALGRTVNMGGIAYTIVGLYETDHMNGTAVFYVPYTTMSVIYNKTRFIDHMTMNTQGITTEQEIEKFTDDYITASSRVHSFHPEDKRALWIWNQAKESIQMEKAKRILHTSFWALGLLTLLSGVVSVSNIMLISVKERTREFGIRRAIGARPWSIIRMVMLESVVITAIFGYIGMLLGVLFCEWMDATVGNRTMDVGFFQTKYFIDPTVGIDVCLWATLVIIIAGALAGFFPAWRAVKVKAIDALRG